MDTAVEAWMSIPDDTYHVNRWDEWFRSATQEEIDAEFAKDEAIDERIYYTFAGTMHTA